MWEYKIFCARPRSTLHSPTGLHGHHEESTWSLHGSPWGPLGVWTAIHKRLKRQLPNAKNISAQYLWLSESTKGRCEDGSQMCQMHSTLMSNTFSRLTALHPRLKCQLPYSKTYLHNIFGEVKAQKVALRMGLRCAECIQHWCRTHSADWQHFTKDLNNSFHMQKTYLHNIFGEVKAQKVDVRMGLRYAKCIQHWCRTHSADRHHFSNDLNDSFHMQKKNLHNIFGEVKAQKVDVRMGDF
jgi:hypothetical protein